MLSASLITAATALAFIRGTTRHYRHVHEAYERAFGDVINLPAAAKNPPAETFERGGTGAAGGRGVWNTQQLGDAYNNSRPLGGAQ